MFCPKCGIQVSDDALFCPKCGYGFSSVGEVSSGSVATPYAGTVSSTVPSTAFEQKLAQAANEGLGMNWYKFIIYVQCFLGGFSGIVTGISQLMGLQYGDRAKLMYRFYSFLKPVDVVFGILFLAIGVLMIYTRFGLKEFKSSAVGLYLILPLASAVSNVLYLFAASVALRTSPLDSSLTSGGTIGLIVGSIGLFVINYIYFNKRRHLFNEV